MRNIYTGADYSKIINPPQLGAKGFFIEVWTLLLSYNTALWVGLI